MDHRAYPKISTRSETSVGGAWVATEKIHGANLVVATDGHVVRVGKRKAWLSPAEPFFGWQLLRAELERAALEVHHALAGRGAEVVLHGELFGGGYPGVAAVPGVQPVQTGVWYTPQVRFALFDVRVLPSDVLLAHAEVVALATRVGLFTAPVVARGTRAAMEAVPVRFASKVPGLFGLPALEGNWAEGLVLKLDRELPVDERAMVKRKIPEFDEGRFDEAVAWPHAQRLSDDALIALASPLVNAARVASARSKVGDGEALVGEIVLDVLVDVSEAFGGAVDALQPEEEARLRGALEALARVRADESRALSVGLAARSSRAERDGGDGAVR